MCVYTHAPSHVLYNTKDFTGSVYVAQQWTKQRKIPAEKTN